MGTFGFGRRLRSLNREYSFVEGDGVWVRANTQLVSKYLSEPLEATDRTAAFSDRATVRSLDAIRRARVAIRDRLAEQGYDEAAWS